MTEILKRPSPFVHPSWISGYLAGDNQCQLAMHLKSNYFLPKRKSDFNLEAYKIKHNTLLNQTANELEEQGYEVFKEHENEYRVHTESGVILACKPDIVAKMFEKFLVVDIKTGTPKAKDIAQVQLYMCTLPTVQMHGIRTIPSGLVVYPDHSFEVYGDSISSDWKSFVTKLLKSATQAELPPASPSCQECKYCAVEAFCDKQSKLIPEAQMNFE
jgi:CRISPR/Cas system-associated exonuclease Cas4 (RecB family)